MTYYHERSELALRAGQDYVNTVLGDGWLVRTELEPNNGWVCLFTLTDAVGLATLTDAVLDVGEVEFPQRRLRRRPLSHRRPPADVPRGKREVEEPVVPTWVPGKKLPWEK